jgi:hypothetical protein
MTQLCINRPVKGYRSTYRDCAGHAIKCADASIGPLLQQVPAQTARHALTNCNFPIALHRLDKRWAAAMVSHRCRQHALVD